MLRIRCRRVDPRFFCLTCRFQSVGLVDAIDPLENPNPNPNPNQPKPQTMKKTILLGALLALVLVAFPVASARAQACDDVFIYWEYGGPTGIKAVMYTDTPYPHTIFATINNTNPTHTGGTPGSGTFIWYGPMNISYGTCRNFRALAYKEGYQDSAISYETVCNPIQ